MLDLALRCVLRLLEPVGFLWACLLVLTVLLLRRGQRRAAAASGALALAVAWHPRRSPTRCDRVIRDALAQVSVLDEATIEAALGDLLDVEEATRALETGPG